MGIVATFLVVYVVAAVVGATVLARLARRVAPRLRSGWFAFALAVVALALTPIPTREGFLFLLPTVVSEKARQRARGTPRQDQPSAAVQRFEGHLPATHLPGHWRDTASGLVWSERVGSVSDVSPPSLEHGRAACRALAPSGYWAVPRNAEFYFLARAGQLEGQWLADVYLATERISVPGRVQGRGQNHAPREAGLSVRCVAVTPPAPPQGYSSADIPRDDWNRYQLGLPPTPR